MSNPKVFISYSHDSDEHREQVLALSERLREDGVETFLDQYLNGSPEQGWPRWMLDQLDAADAVIVICTETYYRRFRGHGPPGKGRGVDWEGALITQEVYDSRSRTVKFLPAFLTSVDESWIPEPLRFGTHYLLTSARGYQSLYDFLLGVAGVEARPVGTIKQRKRRVGIPVSFHGEGESVPIGTHEAPSPPTSKSIGSVNTTRSYLSTCLIAVVLLLILIFTWLAWEFLARRHSEPGRLNPPAVELQKGGGRALESSGIEHEAELRKEEPKLFRGDNVYWSNGAIIRIAFLDGDKGFQDKVFSVAKEWTRYANLTFVQSEVSDSDVRVSFNEPGEWSYMGTQCRSIPKNEKTTNLGIDFDDELGSRHYILHSFGHVLGLIHEHQTPAAKSLVNLEMARSYFGRAPNSWSSEMVDANLRPSDNAGSFYAEKPYDPYSVMLHKFPTAILSPGMTAEPGDQLSRGDIALVRKIYPGK